MMANTHFFRIFDSTFSQAYRDQMRRKLGIRFATAEDDDKDDLLVTRLLETMHMTSADFTNTFRMLRWVKRGCVADSCPERASLSTVWWIWQTKAPAPFPNC